MHPAGDATRAPVTRPARGSVVRLVLLAALGAFGTSPGRLFAGLEARAEGAGT